MQCTFILYKTFAHSNINTAIYGVLLLPDMCNSKMRCFSSPRFQYGKETGGGGRSSPLSRNTISILSTLADGISSSPHTSFARRSTNHNIAFDNSKHNCVDLVCAYTHAQRRLRLTFVVWLVGCANNVVVWRPVLADFASLVYRSPCAAAF